MARLTPERIVEIREMRHSSLAAAQAIADLLAENERLREENAGIYRHDLIHAKAQLADELAAKLRLLHSGCSPCNTCELLIRYRKITEADNG